MEMEINGKAVVLRDRLPAKENWELLELTRKAAGRETTFEEEVSLLTKVIESWDFEGDPGTAESYVELDLFGEFVPLSNAVGTHLLTKAASAKN